MRLLVVTSCTGEKRYHPENQLIQKDFSDKERFANREKELSDFACAAGEMYTGTQHPIRYCSVFGFIPAFA